MTPDLLHRIRWANVARAAAVALALLLVLVWPRLRAQPDAPMLPAAEPAPAVEPVKRAAALEATRLARPARVKEAKAQSEPGSAAAHARMPAKPRVAQLHLARRHRQARQRRTRSPRIAVPAPTRTPTPAPAPVAPPTAAVTPAAEFRP